MTTLKDFGLDPLEAFSFGKALLLDEEIVNDIIRQIKLPTYDGTVDIYPFEIDIPVLLPPNNVKSRMYLLFDENDRIVGINFGVPYGYKYSGKFTKNKEGAMFDSMKIKDIELREVDTVAMEKSLEKIADNNPEIEFVPKGEKAYLVRNGKSLEVSGAEFTSKFKNEIVGKTVAEFTQMRLLYNIIMELNLIKSISLEASDDDILSTIFK